MLAEALNISHETYFAVVLDAKTNGPLVVACAEGGVDIEDVARRTPEKITYLAVQNIKEGPTETELHALAVKLGLGESALVAARAVEQMQRLYRLFTEVDATHVEINPLGTTPDGRVVCFDAKISIDDNASFRVPNWAALNDTSQLDEREIEANRAGLHYVGMEGSIGCLGLSPVWLETNLAFSSERRRTGHGHHGHH